MVSTTAVAVAAPLAQAAATPVAQSPVQPFTQVVRDPVKYQAYLEAARAIGPIHDSARLHALCRGQMERENKEVFYVLCVDMHLHVVHFEELARGSKSSVGIEVEDIWQLLALTRPHAFAVAHCHPSGNARPSRADRSMTREIRKSAKRLFPNTPMLDHIVVGQREYYSFVDNNWE